MKTKNKVLIGIGIVALISMLGFYIYLGVRLSPGMEPLRFLLFNHDESKHDVTVEIFDSSNKTIFNKNYSIEPRGSIQSPVITEKRGKYMFKVTLDNNITRTHKTSVSEGHIGVSIIIQLHSHIDICDLLCD